MRSLEETFKCFHHTSSFALLPYSIYDNTVINASAIFESYTKILLVTDFITNEFYKKIIFLLLLPLIESFTNTIFYKNKKSASFSGTRIFELIVGRLYILPQG